MNTTIVKVIENLKREVKLLDESLVDADNRIVSNNKLKDVIEETYQKGMTAANAFIQQTEENIKDMTFEREETIKAISILEKLDD